LLSPYQWGPFAHHLPSDRRCRRSLALRRHRRRGRARASDL